MPTDTELRLCVVDSQACGYDFCLPKISEADYVYQTQPARCHQESEFYDDNPKYTTVYRYRRDSLLRR